MIAGFIICVLVGYQLLDTIALLLNLRSLKEEVPAEFAGIYDKSEYRRSQQYSRAKAHLLDRDVSGSLAVLGTERI
jgi:hypothetical protein